MNFLDKYKIKRALKSVGDYDFDDVLERFGLERRSVGADLAADIGFFTLGCLCGALVGVFFAPSKGTELRENFKKAIGEKGFIGSIGEGMRSQVTGQA